MSDLEGVELAVTVKPLEWTKAADGDLSRAETIIDTYRVWTHHESDGRWFWCLTGVVDGHAKDEATAKAAAQADYEQRILSALSPSPVPAPLPGSGETESNYPEIPDGWKLVPVEPTKEMIDAGLRKNASNPHPWCPAVYRAMLAASPANPAETQAVEVGK